MNGISKDTFSGMKVDDKLNVLFDMTFEIHQRLETLEKKKLWNMALMSIGGVVGGAVVMVSKIIFG